MKPAFEPVLLCRRPGPRVLPLGIDECRVSVGEEVTARPPLSTNKHEGYRRPWNENEEARNGVELRREEAHDKRQELGRWPANVAIDDSPEVLEAFAAFGEKKAGAYSPPKARKRKAHCLVESNGASNAPDNYGDTGTAARFFYCAKASRRERNAGLEGMPEQVAGAMRGNQTEVPSRTAGDGVTPVQQVRAANHHPCVKPLALMRWLVALVCPPGGVCLDPFAGSGTTGVACVETGRRFVGIEQDAGYHEIARRRIEAAKRNDMPLFAETEES